MRAVQIECSCREWWGENWKDSLPYSIDACTVTSDHGLPNAPVTIYVMTPDHLEAAQLLRIAAARLERDPTLLMLLNEPGSSPNNPTLPGSEECPF